ncbi:hypothetical protein [Streptomyces sp. NPDC013489]|uniref:hypothetical protein n=1 Tax=Streptomyces sp. NPDC013489 TaxID=3155606 RepID=UPI00340147FE
MSSQKTALQPKAEELILLDRLIAAGLIRPAVGTDANIPARFTGGSRSVNASDVTFKAGLFVILVILPLLLITGTWEAPASVALVWLALLGARGSVIRYQRVRYA